MRAEPRPQRKRLIWDWVAGLVVLLALAGLGLFLLSTLSTPTPMPTSGMSPSATPVIGPLPQEIAIATPPGTQGTGGSSQTAEGFPTATTTAMTETQPPTSTLALSPTVTAIPSPTFTAMPSPSAPPSATPTATRPPKPPWAESTATAMPTRSPYPAPTLLMPEAGANLSGGFRFTWRYDGPPLGKGYAFDLRIWLEQDKDRPKEQRQGAIEPTQQTEIEVDLDNVPAIQQYGRGVYYWGVVVVRVPDCYPRCSVEIVGEWSEEREFTYGSPSLSCETFDCETNCGRGACEDEDYCQYCCGGCK